MKLKGRGILVFCLLLFGGYAFYDYLQDKHKNEATLEENRLMTVDFQQVDSVEIQRVDQNISLKRSVDGWELVSPIKDLADNTAVDDFVKNIFPESSIEVAKEGEGIDWATYGLDKPLAKISLKTASGEQNVYEVSEKKNFEENVFLRRNQENKVLVVNANWLTRAKRTVMDFRDRRLLRQKIASVDVVNLQNKKGTVEIKRTDGQWISTKHKDLKLDQNKVRALLQTIADAKGSEIFAAGTKVPDSKQLFVLDLTLADKKWKAVVTQSKDLGIYATVTEPGLPMKLEAGALDRLIEFTVDDLKEVPAEKKDPLEKKTEPSEDDKQAMMAIEKEQK